MYSGYRFNFDHYEKRFYDIGMDLYSADKAIVENELSNFALSKNTLDGTAIMENWFPNIVADVFLSHSHADEKQVITLAGFLYEKFNLKTFIDSCVWGYSVELLREIDNRFCRNEFSNNYSYEKRNYSTSHVHMMLSISLMKMMDQTECLLFIDTPNSLNTKEIIDATNSPWIFAEIAMSQTLRRKPKEEHRQRLLKSVRESTENFSNIAYRLDKLHLKEMTEDVFKKWCQYYNPKNGHGLDVLYDILPMEEENERIF